MAFIHPRPSLRSILNLKAGARVGLTTYQFSNHLFLLEGTNE
jgi:hypothetical protein